MAVIDFAITAIFYTRVHALKVTCHIYSLLVVSQPSEPHGEETVIDNIAVLVMV